MSDNKFLRSEIVLQGDTPTTLAEFLGISYQTLNRKLSGEADFTQTEMNKLRTKYQMDDEKFSNAFKKEID
jgi:plasmid maintenance system antidote protein VapI